MEKKNLCCCDSFFFLFTTVIHPFSSWCLIKCVLPSSRVLFYLFVNCLKSPVLCVDSFFFCLNKRFEMCFKSQKKYVFFSSESLLILTTTNEICDWVPFNFTRNRVVLVKKLVFFCLSDKQMKIDLPTRNACFFYLFV